MSLAIWFRIVDMGFMGTHTSKKYERVLLDPLRLELSSEPSALAHLHSQYSISFQIPALLECLIQRACRPADTQEPSFIAACVNIDSTLAILFPIPV